MKTTDQEKLRQIEHRAKQKDQDLRKLCEMLDYFRSRHGSGQLITFLKRMLIGAVCEAYPPQEARNKLKMITCDFETAEPANWRSVAKGGRPTVVR